MENFTLTFVVEPDGDHWFAFVPELLEQGVSTWGHTKEEAGRNLVEVLKMTIEELPKEGKDLYDCLQHAAEVKEAVGPWGIDFGLFPA